MNASPSLFRALRSMRSATRLVAREMERLPSRPRLASRIPHILRLIDEASLDLGSARALDSSSTGRLRRPSRRQPRR